MRDHRGRGAPATRAPSGSGAAPHSPKRGARAPPSTACAPSLCLRLAGEPRFRGACSRQTLTGLGCSFVFLLPAQASEQPGSSPSFRLELVRVALGCSPAEV